MAKHASWTDEYVTLVEDCEKREERLTSWEHDFLVSLRNQLEAGRAISPRQIETLENIWEKVTRRG